MIPQQLAFLAMEATPFGPSVMPIAIDSYFLPILSSGLPGNVILCTFKTGCGSSIVGETIHRPQTVTFMGPLLWMASSAAMLLSCRRLVSETGARM